MDVEGGWVSRKTPWGSARNGELTLVAMVALTGVCGQPKPIIVD